MKPLREKIKVMQAALDGKEIEWASDENGSYTRHTMDSSSFNWDSFDYRIKPEPIMTNKKIIDVSDEL